MCLRLEACIVDGLSVTSTGWETNKNTKRTGLESFILELMLYQQKAKPPKHKEDRIRKFYIRLDVTSTGRETTKTQRGGVGCTRMHQSSIFKEFTTFLCQE